MGGTCCAGNKVSPDLGEISGRRVLKVVFEAQRCLLSFFLMSDYFHINISTPKFLVSSQYVPNRMPLNNLNPEFESSKQIGNRVFQIKTEKYKKSFKLLHPLQ